MTHQPDPTPPHPDTSGPADHTVATPPPGQPHGVVPSPRQRYGVEVLVVLGTSLGASALYAVLSLLRTLDTVGLKEGQATLNPSRASNEWLDLAYQIVGRGLDLVPVALALLMLWYTAPGVRRRIGFNTARPFWDTGTGALLAAAIGLPGLALYVAGRALGVTAHVVPVALNEHWWQVPILVFAALTNGIVEEVIVVAYLADRLPRLGWGPLAALTGSSLLRGSYHLYQGFGAFVGNVVMGVVFWWFYRKYGRVMPLVIAHTVLDVVAFVGYALIGSRLPWLA